MRIALYQPDIPQNTGTILRLAACLCVGVDIIEPAGFDASDRNLRRAGLDYWQYVTVKRHANFDAFREACTGNVSRMVLLTTRANAVYADFSFRPSDTLLVGRESAGVPEEVHAAADARIRIPMAGGMRSLNVAVALAMVLGEALRQT